LSLDFGYGLLEVLLGKWGICENNLNLDAPYYFEGKA